MRRDCILLTVGVVCALGDRGAGAQTFNSGSNGSYGPINVIANTTLDLPPDGVLNATTILVAGGATLTFRANALNTPAYLLATGNIDVYGIIDVSGDNGTSNPPTGGKGGPGGFDGGHPGFGAAIPPGSGNGPGGGLGGDTSNGANGAGAGAYGCPISAPYLFARDGSTYGSPLLVPLLGGSGGGGTSGTPGYGGGGGGGALLLASNTKVTIRSGGQIKALGGSSNGYSYGSGGAIRIVAPVVAGSGSLNVSASYGGCGRIRVDTIDRTGLTLSFQPSQAVSVGSFMVVFPDTIPRLDIIEAAGAAIQEGRTDPILVTLPFGSEPRQNVTVQARGFLGVVPVDVVLTPDSGDRRVYCSEIDTATGNPATVDVQVDLPVNNATRVSAWTRGLRCSGCTDNSECDDGLYCNGAETCDLGLRTCRSGTSPCQPGCGCDENNDQCNCGP